MQVGSTTKNTGPEIMAAGGRMEGVPADRERACLGLALTSRGSLDPGPSDPKGLKEPIASDP